MKEKIIINVGTKNPAKLEAVGEILKDYPHLAHAEIVPCDVSSDVEDQPSSLQEVMDGARNRARNAFENCTYSIGLESGLMHVPHTKTGVMDVCACAIYDGKQFHFGLSSGWEVPAKVAELMHKEKIDMNEAAFRAGFTKNPKVGSAEGLVGIVTKGRLTRKEYTKQALLTALIHIDII